MSLAAMSALDARMSAIRDRIAAMRPAATAVTSTGGDDGPSPDGAGFDPFGAAYQLALQTTIRRAPDPVVTATTAPTTSGAQLVRRSEALSSPTAAGAVTAATTAASSRPGALSGAQVARLAYNAGFRGQDLVDVVAISGRESGWRPDAFNGNAATNDLSYGLMQINMKGSLGPANLQRFHISANEQLLDPQTNMDAAFVLYQANGNTLRPWGGYKGMSNTYGTDIAAAQQAVADAHLDGA